MIMKKIGKYVPVFLWFVYVAYNLSSSVSLVRNRLNAISLSRDLTVGGYSSVYSIVAYASFLDELLLLGLAITVSVILSKKINK